MPTVGHFSAGEGNSLKTGDLFKRRPNAVQAFTLEPPKLSRGFPALIGKRPRGMGAVRQSVGWTAACMLQKH
jgi:hypothetical protein